MDVKEKETAPGVGVNSCKQRLSPRDLPVWDPLEQVSSSSNSSGYSKSSSSSRYSQSTSSSGYFRKNEFSGRHYNKSLLIKNDICLAYQHGNCIYGDQGIKHENAFGRNVLHFCGLCWTDSPDNQCYYPATECPGPEHNL